MKRGAKEDCLHRELSFAAGAALRAVEVNMHWLTS